MVFGIEIGAILFKGSLLGTCIERACKRIIFFADGPFHMLGVSNCKKGVP